LIRAGSVVKFNYVVKFNDSIMFDSHGKLPGFIRVMTLDRPSYDFQEIITDMKKGDSAVTVQMADTLLKAQSQLLPPNAKKGDRVTFAFRVTEVFLTDSVARADYNKEVEKDRPRAMKEQEEQMAKIQKEREDQMDKQIANWEKSGEVAKEINEMEAYLSSKKINAQKTGKGTFVRIDQQGTGPAAEVGKYVKVKYTGMLLPADSVFESNVYVLRLGKDAVIRGWTEGLQLFKQGGKGCLYIPGFLAYADGGGGPTSKPFAPLKFDVEILEVSDHPIVQ
jgi:FKBP-type peptidyl-prolyl cis-trans isomerase